MGHHVQFVGNQRGSDVDMRKVGLSGLLAKEWMDGVRVKSSGQSSPMTYSYRATEAVNRLTKYRQELGG